MFTRTLALGKVAYGGKRRINACELKLRISQTTNERRDWDTLETLPAGQVTVSVCGAIWNGSHTDHVAGGQCIDTISRYIRTKTVRRIEKLWSEYHLNDMKSGTLQQTEAIKRHVATLMTQGDDYRTFCQDHYGNSCRFLESVGLLVDRGYRYGTEWLLRRVPVGAELALRELFTGTFRTAETGPEWIATLEANPTDATLRMVYADWLQDHGQDTLAADQRACAERMGVLQTC